MKKRNLTVNPKDWDKTQIKIIPGYMGIKTQLLSRIQLEIEQISKKNDIILDIFSGSGSVGYFLKKKFIVYANDIEPFSYHINSFLLDNSIKKNDFESFDLKTFEKYFEKNFSLLENLDDKDIKISDYKKNCQKFPYILFTSYFSGSYFGKIQAMQIDSLRYAIDQVDQKYKNLLLSCLIYACYQTVSSVGGHFAQPKIIKERNFIEINDKRKKDVKKFFLEKFVEAKEHLYVNKKKNRVFRSDFNDLLSINNKSYFHLKNVAVTYIDPPYTIDHYSRFYHILNTLVLYDYPESKGVGLYREDRFQSNFSIKSKAYKELEKLISKLCELGSNIVMSYSDGNRVLLSDDQISSILKKYYQLVKSPIKIDYFYSGFGRSAFNRANELIFVATHPIKS